MITQSYEYQIPLLKTQITTFIKKNNPRQTFKPVRDNNIKIVSKDHKLNNIRD